MFNKLKQLAKRLNKESSLVDAEMFHDPVAEMTEWSPAVEGGTKFTSHRLKRVSDHRMEFVASTISIIISLLACGIGAGVMGTFIVLAIMNPVNLAGYLIAAGAGALFFLLGGRTYMLVRKPVVFDKKASYFWKGRKSYQDALENIEKYPAAKLKDVHAIQLVAEYVRSGKTSYYSYELNLVLNDGSRLNVIDHSNRRRIELDAKRLANFLGIPVWSGIIETDEEE